LRAISYLAVKGGSSRKAARAERCPPETTAAALGRVAEVIGFPSFFFVVRITNIIN